MIHHVSGNALDPRKRPAAILHVVNDVGAFGAGIAGEIAARWPHAKGEYLQWISRDPPLGSVLWSRISDTDAIAHILAQRGLPSWQNRQPLDLDALALGLRTVAASVPSTVSVHMPRLGCGLARGRWERVLPIVERELGAFECYVYSGVK